ncbi:MAG: DinB family protein [Planctomycetota bacterium]
MNTQWELKTQLFDLMRTMAGEMALSIPDEHFNEPRGGSNSPKWITGHLALGMDFGLSLLGEPTDAIAEMMPIYGPGSSGGRVEDSRTREGLVEHLRSVGDTLKLKVASASEERLAQPQSTPFLANELPTVGGLLAHVYTTHIALHLGQLSQIRRELGMPSYYQF